MITTLVGPLAPVAPLTAPLVSLTVPLARLMDLEARPESARPTPPARSLTARVLTPLLPAAALIPPTMW